MRQPVEPDAVQFVEVLEASIHLGLTKSLFRKTCHNCINQSLVKEHDMDGVMSIL